MDTFYVYFNCIVLVISAACVLSCIILHIKYVKEKRLAKSYKELVIELLKKIGYLEDLLSCDKPNDDKV